MGGYTWRKRGGYMDRLILWAQSPLVALTRTLTWAKYQVSKHPLAKNVDNFSMHLKGSILWVVMSQVLRLVLLLITLLGMTVVFLLKQSLKEIYIVTIKRLWDWTLVMRRKLSYTLSCMGQELPNSVRSLVKGRRKDKK